MKTMGGKLILSLALLVISASPIQSFPSGAPAEACADLRPDISRHLAGPQTSASPFELDMGIFEDLSSADMFAVPVTYSYAPSTTYNREFVLLAELFSSLLVCSVTLRVNPSELAANNTSAFRGFFIQARLAADDSNVGGFLDPLPGQEYQLSSCTPSTVRLWACV
jgi:hypothetical protein